MNEKQILKEIAYYSKLIDNHKKHEERSNNMRNAYSYKTYNTYLPNSKTYNLDKYKYVKKPESSVILPALEKKSTKVLINPNFKQSVHINPRFNGVTKLQVLNPVVHINPKIININLINSQKQIVQPTLPLVKNLVSFHKVAKSPLNTNKINKTPQRKRLISVRSKYKIIKSNLTPGNNKTVVNNRFKIDRRSKISRIKQKKKLIFTQSINDNIRTCLFKNKTWRRATLKIDQNTTNNNSKTQTKLENVKNRRSLLLLQGKKYVVGSNKKTLKLITNSKTTSTSKKNLVKRVSVKKTSLTYNRLNSINTSISRVRKLQFSYKKNEVSNFCKNNIPCPVYRRFGKCRRKDAGRCAFKHNPDQIALCKNFLQGACLEDDCLLSHKVSLAKMPTCKYFLEGCCFRTTCPYLHVKISPNAEICRDFLEGFCKEAIKCDKRHQYLCPDFERRGKCEKRRCRYPHKSKCVKDKPIKPPKPDNKLKEKPVKLENQDQLEVQRYYAENKVQQKATDKVSNENGSENNDEVYKRVKLGILPSFIPFE